VIKVSIECEGVKATVEQQDAMTLTEALELLDGALRGVGYCFTGELGIITPENPKEE